MPNYDGTGPEGKGPMTDFGRGYCVIPISNSEQEIELLRNQEHVLKAQLKQIRNRIKGVKTEKEAHHARI
jgi:hypothetical protein